MDREVSCAVIHGVAKSQTRLNDWTELNWKTIFCKIQTFHVQYLQVRWYLLQEELSGIYTEFGVSSMTSAPIPPNFSLVLKLHFPETPGADDWVMSFKLQAPGPIPPPGL